MLEESIMLLAFSLGNAAVISMLVLLWLISVILLVLALKYGLLWLQAYLCSAEVTLLELIGMSFRRVDPRLIVTAKVMGTQAGLNIDRQHGMSTAHLEAHFLAGGDVMRVLQAIIAAHASDIDLDFDRAAAIDLAGRDVLDSVRTSIAPKVIDCPEYQQGGKNTLTAIAQNGVELRTRARVTVRTNLAQLIGGATEETIIARVGQGIISTIGAAPIHMDVLERPDRISKGVLNAGLDANAAFEIVSLDIADIDIGDNIGARLQIDQANADMRVAQAKAEMRLAEAVARQQEMKAKVRANNADLLLAEAEIPTALAEAFRRGQFHASSQRATDKLPMNKTRRNSQSNAGHKLRSEIWQIPFGMEHWETKAGT